MKFGFYTLGCKVNQFETQALTQLAVSLGHEICHTNADAFIINTCTVTSVSDHKNIRAIHKIKKDNPNAIIAVCGCFAQTNPEKLTNLSEIDIVCGTSNRAQVIDLCLNTIKTKEKQTLVENMAVKKTFESLPAGILENRTRALLKVQDGCDNYCTYCIIPYARGHIRSMSLDNAVNEARRLSDNGVSEIIITGIEISSYGKDFEKKVDLAALIDAVCTEIPNVRFRLGSIEPRTITEEFCRVIQTHPNVAQHFHLSLQSGSSSILSRMKRRYSAEDFYGYVCLLRKYFPDCSITTDLIVGFPGETEEEFNETLSFIKRCQFADMHVFPYSARTGTVAADMPGQLSVRIKNERANITKAIAKDIAAHFLSGFIGKKIEVLLEHFSDGYWSGHSNWHFSVKVQTAHGAKNKLLAVQIIGLENGFLIGRDAEDD